MNKMKKYINPHLAKAKSMIKNENDPGFDPLVDDTPEGTEDIEDIDDWIKEITEK